MTEDHIFSMTDKKTDEPIDISENDRHDDEEVPKFTVLDILRMLAGLILFGSVLCRVLSGHWFYLPSKASKTDAQQEMLQIPAYWSTVKQGQTPMTFSLDELSKYSGESDSERILLSVKGHVFDVTRGSHFYGKWGTYRKFTGTDCSKLFSYPQWDLSVLGKECSNDLSDSTEKELARVEAWLSFFRKKYPEVGFVEGLVNCESEDAGS